MATRSEEQLRVTLGVSTTEGLFAENLATLVNNATGAHGLGATLTDTVGSWQGQVEHGVRIEIVYPTLRNSENWFYAGNRAVMDVLKALYAAFPEVDCIQKEAEVISMVEITRESVLGS